MAPVLRGGRASDQPFLDQRFHRLAGSGAADIPGFGQLADGILAAADVAQEVELLDAQAKLLRRRLAKVK